MHCISDDIVSYDDNDEDHTKHYKELVTCS